MYPPGRVMSYTESLNSLRLRGNSWRALRLNSLVSLDIKRKQNLTAKLAKKSRQGRKAWNNEIGTLHFVEEIRSRNRFQI